MNQETRTSTSDKHTGIPAPGMVDTKRVIRPNPSDLQAPIIPLLLDPPGHDILKVIQRLKKNGVPVNEGTVFAHLIRKDGLPNPEVAIDEE